MVVRDVADGARESTMAPAIWLTIPMALPASMTFGARGIAANVEAETSANLRHPSGIE